MTVVGALTCGLTLATAIGHLEASIGQPALSVALLVLATAASYTGTPDGFDATRTSGWQLVITRLRRLQEDRRRHRELRPPRAGGAIAGATVPQLYQEPAAPVPQLFAAERSALLFWRYRVAIGEAAQRGFEQHLADHSLRQSPGVWRPISDWSCGAPPVVPGAKQEVTSVAGEQSDMADQVTRVTRAAKRALARRGLLDTTHGLWVPGPPARPLAYPNGTAVGPGGDGAEAVVTTGDHPLPCRSHGSHRGTLASADNGR